MGLKNKYDFDVIVIGGGASGMTAAGRSAELGKKVLLLEKNPDLGEKLKITGGGRCNITHAEYDNRILLKKYGKAENFLYSPFSLFGVKDTFNFFEKLGLPLMTEEYKRVFPKTEKALDVLKALEKYMRKGGVTVKTNSPVFKISKDNKRIVAVKIKNETYTANSYIIATGGVSHPETGSTGDGFKWLADLGHKIKTPTPNIVPLLVKDAWIKTLSGISVEDIKITFYVDNIKNFSKIGKILFTHFGLSGPMILNSASKIRDLLPTGTVTAKIDLFPKLNELELENKIIKIFDENKNKIFKNTLEEILPKGTTKGIISLLKIDPDKKIHSITKEERKELVIIFKALPIKITGLMDFEKSVVSDGGVDLTEIDMKTMRSKIIENLFITGDLLDINRQSGGFSLQICWTTGYLAGSNA